MEYYTRGTGISDISKATYTTASSFHNWFNVLFCLDFYCSTCSLLGVWVYCVSLCTCIVTNGKLIFSSFSKETNLLHQTYGIMQCWGVLYTIKFLVYLQPINIDQGPLHASRKWINFQIDRFWRQSATSTISWSVGLEHWEGSRGNPQILKSLNDVKHRRQIVVQSCV